MGIDNIDSQELIKVLKDSGINGATKKARVKKFNMLENASEYEYECVIKELDGNEGLFLQCLKEGNILLRKYSARHTKSERILVFLADDESAYIRKEVAKRKFEKALYRLKGDKTYGVQLELARNPLYQPSTEEIESIMNEKTYEPEALRLMVNAKENTTEKLQIRYIKSKLNVIGENNFLPTMKKVTEQKWRELFQEEIIGNSWSSSSKTYQAFFKMLSKEEQAILSISDRL